VRRFIQALYLSWKKKHDRQGEAGLKVTYDIRSKELKASCTIKIEYYAALAKQRN
jgi:hypothetical protein